MPKKVMDYSNTHFYKIVCKDVNIKDCYVGHTTNFIKRKCTQKECCLNMKSKHYNLPLYQFIRANGNWENWDMILIDTANCNNRLDARRQERHLIEQITPSLNTQKPMKQETIKEYKQDWYNENKDRIHLEQKQKYNNNKEENKDKYRKYYWSNRDSKLTVEHCQCGSTFVHSGKSRHLKTAKHQQYLKSLQPEETPEQ